eukprot:1826984-Prorocentrum_lima.AAC.1
MPADDALHPPGGSDASAYRRPGPAMRSLPSQVPTPAQYSHGGVQQPHHVPGYMDGRQSASQPFASAAGWHA